METGIYNVQRIIYQIVILFSAVQILLFVQEVDRDENMQILGKLAEDQILNEELLKGFSYGV